MTPPFSLTPTGSSLLRSLQFDQFRSASPETINGCRSSSQSECSKLVLGLVSGEAFFFYRARRHSRTGRRSRAPFSLTPTGSSLLRSPDFARSHRLHERLFDGERPARHPEGVTLCAHRNRSPVGPPKRRFSSTTNASTPVRARDLVAPLAPMLPLRPIFTVGGPRRPRRNVGGLSRGRRRSVGFVPRTSPPGSARPGAIRRRCVHAQEPTTHGSRRGRSAFTTSVKEMYGG